MIRELTATFTLAIILLQIVVIVWVIDTLGKIKIYLRDIRNTLQRSNWNQ